MEIDIPTTSDGGGGDTSGGGSTDTGDSGGGDTSGGGAVDLGPAPPPPPPGDFAPPTDGGDISIGTPPPVEGITIEPIGNLPAPPDDGSGDGQTITIPAPPIQTDTTTDTGTDTTTTPVTTTITTGIGIGILPPPTITFPAPPPQQGPPDQGPPGDQGGGDFPPPELPPITLPPGIPPGIFTPTPQPAPAPAPGRAGAPGRATTTTTTVSGSTTLNLTPIIFNVIQPPAPLTGPLPVSVDLSNQILTVSLPGLERITSEIQSGIADLAATTADVGNRIAADIHTEITQLFPTEIEALQAQARSLGDLVDAVSTAFPDDRSIADSLAAVVAEKWTVVQPELDQLLSTSIGDGLLNAITTAAAGGAPKISGLFASMPGGDCAGALIKGFLLPLAAEGLITDGLAVILGAADVLRVFIDAAMRGPALLIEGDSMACAVPTLLTPAEINDAANRGTLADVDVHNQLSRAGYSDQLIPVLRSLARRLLERDDVLNAELRGMFDPAASDAALTQLGYSAEDIATIKQLRQLLPTPTDLVSWMLRDLFPAPIASVDFDADFNASFTESSEAVNFVQEFGMDLEFPKDVLPLFAQLGLSEEFAHRYWQAHWELPSPQQGAEMYQRGFINLRAFNRLLRARGVEPYWRKPFEEIIFNPITRVDIRRIHKLLGKDHEWLVRSYQNIGYSPDNAELLAQFTEQLNSTADKAVKLNEVTTLKSEIESLYLDGTIDGSTATAQLVQLGFPADHVQAFVAGAELKRQAGLMRQVSAAIKQLYITLHWDKPTATAALTKEGFSDENISRLFESWDLDRDYRELTQQEKQHRELTTGEILQAYGEAVINATTATEHLKALHYSDIDVATMLELENIKVAKADQAAVIDSLHEQFLAGTLDRAAAVSAMDAARISHTRREGLLAKWALELQKKSARLTTAQIQQLWTLGLIDQPTAEDELAREGYSVTDRALLLKLFSATSTRTEATQAATAARQQQAQKRQTAHGLTAQQIEATFKDGVLTEQGARDYLAELGYRQQAIDQLIKQWRPAP